MSQIASHTELNTGLAMGSTGIPLISALGPDSWQFALNGHTPDYPRTLTVTRTRAKIGSQKYGWKFVISVLEEDVSGQPLPQPHVAYFEVRPTKGGASGVALHALIHGIAAVMNNCVLYNLDEYAASYTPGSINQELLEKGYALENGALVPCAPVVP